MKVNFFIYRIYYHYNILKIYKSLEIPCSFERQVFPELSKAGLLNTYTVSGDMLDVGTLESYISAHVSKGEENWISQNNVQISESATIKNSVILDNCIIEDNVTITVDAVIYYEPTDPKSLVYNVEDFITAATKLAQTNLRNVVGDLELDAALTSRETINTSLKLILDEATDKWGTRVVRVEIQRIDPPQDVQDAMNKVCLLYTSDAADE